jgi:hypothetical protein
VFEGDVRRRLHFRTTAGWQAALERVGFTVRVHALEDTPLANVLLSATKP